MARDAHRSSRPNDGGENAATRTDRHEGASPSDLESETALRPASSVLCSMKDSLTAGVRGQSHHIVDASMSPPHLPTKVLSTPSMIGLIEQVCLMTVQEHLDDGETTVGIHVCVSHSASVSAGERIGITCELTEIDRRRLTFQTNVTSGDRVVSEGTHQRFVVRPAGG